MTHCFHFNLFYNLEKDPIFNDMTRLVAAINRQNHQQPVLNNSFKKQIVTGLMQNISRRLLAYYVDNPVALEDGWQDYLLNLILADENPFSRLAQKLPLDQIGSSYLTGLKADLDKLNHLFRLSWPELINKLTASGLKDWGANPADCLAAAGWNRLNSAVIGVQEENQLIQAKKECKLAFLSCHDWKQLIPRLATYYLNFGTGITGRYWAFRIDFATKRLLVGISQPDPIRFSQLIGYDHIKTQLINNTAKFVAGLPANNILLYGDRGTGKSSMVKALLHHFGPKGLRMIEVTKSQLTELPSLTAVLKNYAQKFILFVDDLSFENNENTYKIMKSVLEGSLEVKPANILIYATSNRRHLIKENFSDRKTDNSGDEVRTGDTMQEKLSLSDRFGITLVFPGPSQQQYLNIVKGLVKERLIQIAGPELEQLALQWELWQNGRSGRTAKQFVDHLEGELVNKKEPDL